MPWRPLRGPAGTPAPGEACQSWTPRLTSSRNRRRPGGQDSAPGHGPAPPRLSWVAAPAGVSPVVTAAPATARQLRLVPGDSAPALSGSILEASGTCLPCVRGLVPPGGACPCPAHGAGLL